MIRKATFQDVPRVAALSEELGYPLDEATAAGVLERLAASEADLVLVAVTDANDVIGWIHAGERELLESGRRIEILGLVVSRSWRRRGVGATLMDAVEGWARERGVAELAVRSNVTRAESHPFYERRGFVRVKTQHAYRKRLNGVPNRSVSDGSFGANRFQGS